MSTAHAGQQVQVVLDRTPFYAQGAARWVTGLYAAALAAQVL